MTWAGSIPTCRSRKQRRAITSTRGPSATETTPISRGSSGSRSDEDGKSLQGTAVDRLPHGAPAQPDPDLPSASMPEPGGKVPDAVRHPELIEHPLPLIPVREDPDRPPHLEHFPAGVIAQHRGKGAVDLHELSLRRDPADPARHVLHQRAVLLLGAAERLLRPPSHHGGLLEIGHLLPQSDHLVDEVLFWAMLVSHPVTRGSVGLLPMETDEREGRTRTDGGCGRRVRNGAGYSSASLTRRSCGHWSA